MKALFVDFDGVLNSGEWFKTVTADERKTITQDDKIDPAKVVILDDLLEVTGAMMVISSTWRLGRSVESLVVVLERHGFTHGPRVIGKTPWAPEPTEALRVWVREQHHTDDEIQTWLKENVECRGDEIQTWMDEYHEAHPDDPIEAFAILDDDVDMAHLRPWLVNTTWERGLELEHRNRAIRLLRQPCTP